MIGPAFAAMNQAEYVHTALDAVIGRRFESSQLGGCSSE